MLLGLTLKNFAIVDDISVNFGKGLNIITGETGAGKSIILDAINFILGDKASTDIIKSGKEEAHVEALFDISENMTLTDRLNSLGIQSAGSELLIKRIITSKGKGRVFINGSIATIGMLEQLTDGLIDIFGQHEHQSLLKEVNHLKVLDEFGGLTELTLGYSTLYHKYNGVSKEFEEFKKNRAGHKEKEDFLRFQCKEIDLAELKPGEEQQLHNERKILANAEKLHSITKHSYENIYEGEGSVFDLLKGIRGEIEKVVDIDGSLIGIAETIERGSSEIEEAAFNLRDYRSNLHYDTERLDTIEARLQDINRIKQKHGVSIEKILERRKEMEEELEKFSNYDEREKELEKTKTELEQKIKNRVTELSQRRLKAAQRLSQAVEKGIRNVGIKGGKYLVDIDKKEMSPSGCDRVTFLFSANPDEKTRPISKVASGGELSRIMLVLKEVISRVEGGSILIFDEADSGIGGAVAETVGRKIEELSKKYQVICITHLPQVAKFAKTHFKVTKSFKNNVTKIDVKVLDDEEGVKELARMLGGIKITKKTIEAAREMIEK